MFDVLAIGELNCDYIFTGLDKYPEADKEIIARGFTQTLGSSTAICASGLAALGLSTGFCTLIGNDANGLYALEQLKKNGIDTTYVNIDDTVQTGITAAMMINGDRALVTCPGAIELFSMAHMDAEMLSRTKHIHVGSFFLQKALQKDLPKLFFEAKKQGITTSLDAGWDDSGNWDSGIWDVLKYTDIFFPNEGEALRITNEDTPEEAAKKLNVPYAVVKCGKKGSICFHDNQLYTHPVYSVTAVDTTGAGDSFNAGFLYGFLNHFSPDRSLSYGNACGAVCVSNVGGASGCASLADIKRLREENQ